VFDFCRRCFIVHEVEPLPLLVLDGGLLPLFEELPKERWEEWDEADDDAERELEGV